MLSTADPTRRDRLRWTGLVAAGTSVLLWAELFLTADADEPNTWTGVITDTIVLAVATVVALLVVSWGTSGVGRERKAAIVALVLTILAAVPFWTGAATVLGVATFLLARSVSRPVGVAGAVIGAAIAVFLIVETVVSFAPGVPS